MSTISLRLPDSLHDKVRELAERENISINQLVTLALAEKISALMTEEYLGERAKRGNKKSLRWLWPRCLTLQQKSRIESETCPTRESSGGFGDVHEDMN
ncbi:MAG: toxin-antitoxin system HicB family antitoxin [Candidatus Desulfacyla sp.]